MDKLDMLLIAFFVMWVSNLFLCWEIYKLRKQNEKLRDEMIRQQNEELAMQNNFDTDPVK